MHFSKIIPATLFAALAVAAPAPAPQTSVDFAQLKQFSQSVQSWASSTNGGFDGLKSQYQTLGLSGEAAQSLDQAFNQLEKDVADITSVASQIASALDGMTDSYQQSEQSNADLFG